MPTDDDNAEDTIVVHDRRGLRFAIIYVEDLDTPEFRGLSGGALRVYLALAAHTNSRGVCWPTQTKLGALTGLARETVNRSLRELVLSGLVSKSESFGRTCVYELLPAPSRKPGVRGQQK